MDDNVQSAADWDAAIGEVSWGDDRADTAPSDTAAADQQQTSAAEQTETATDTTEATESSASDQKFSLKHLDETHDVTLDEMKTLAQKGLDYDRQRQKFDDLTAKNTALNGQLESLPQLLESDALLKELAKEQGLTVQQLVDDVKATRMADKEGILKEVALERLKFQRELSQKDAKAETTPEKTPEQQATERREREVKEFIETYPTVDPKTMPQAVWESVAKGQSLLTAYQSHKIKELEAAQAAEKQNKENRAKATPSQASAGNKSTKADPYEADWYKN